MQIGAICYYKLTYNFPGFIVIDLINSLLWLVQILWFCCLHVDVIQWLDENACRIELSCLFALVVLGCLVLCPRSVSHANAPDFVCWFPRSYKVPDFVCRLLNHKDTTLHALVLPINKKYQTSRAAYLAKMTADQSLFTELLPDKRKAANGAAVEKG